MVGFSLFSVLKAEEIFESVSGKIKRIFLLYVVGLIIVEKDASCCKMAEYLGAVSHDKLTRILSQGAVLVNKFTALFINFCLSQTTGGFLILDDVLVPKRFSKLIEGVYNEYDHVEKERVKGMRIVMLLWSDGNLRIPIAWAIWHKEDKTLIGFTKKGQPKYKHTGLCSLKLNGQSLPYKTKNKIGMELVAKVIEKGLKPQYIALDTWYAGKRNLKTLQRLNIPCYSRIKSNRIVIFQGKKITIKSLAESIPISSFNYKHNAYIKAQEVYLPGFGNI